MYLSKYNFGDDYRIWNPWNGCFKISEGCKNCYIKIQNQFIDEYHPFPHTDAKMGSFISVALRSDFFLEEADHLRPRAWAEIKNNPQYIFLIITKRVERIIQCLPQDWGAGYNNVVLCATAENQRCADQRLPFLLMIPARHKWITCSPLLEPIDLSLYLNSGEIEHVEITGEHTKDKSLSRPTNYEWVKDIHRQCVQYNVRFSLLYLGYNFVMPDGEIKQEWAPWYRAEIADSLGLYNYKPISFNLENHTIIY